MSQQKLTSRAFKRYKNACKKIMDSDETDVMKYDLIQLMQTILWMRIKDIHNLEDITNEAISNEIYTQADAGKTTLYH